MEFRVHEQFLMSYRNIFKSFCDMNEVSFSCRVFLTQIGKICDEMNDTRSVFEINLKEMADINDASDSKTEVIVEDVKVIATILAQIVICSDLECSDNNPKPLFSKCEVYRGSLVLYKDYKCG